MKRYDEAIRSVYPDREYFFPGKSNTFHDRNWVQKNFRKIWESTNPGIYATAYELRRQYAIEKINQWIRNGLGFHDKLLYLSKSMGHTTVESTKYYYSLVPGLAGLMKEMTQDDFDWIVPEADDE